MHNLALLFSGQGAQYPGMGYELYNGYKRAKEIFDLCDNLRAGIKDLCFWGPQNELSKTVNTQPCIFATSLAMAFVLEDLGLKPSVVAGFSVGEIAALTFAGVMTIEDGFFTVCERAKIMHLCSLENPGSMYAVLGLNQMEVKKLLADIKDIHCANINTIDQIVVSVPEVDEKLFLNTLNKSKIRNIKLRVSGGFHSPLMKEASNEFRTIIDNVTFHKSKYPVYSNVTATHYNVDNIEMKDYLAKQIMEPVLWLQTIQHMLFYGINCYLETGPGKVLQGLVKKTDKSALVLSAENKDDLNLLKTRGILC